MSKVLIHFPKRLAFVIILFLTTTGCDQVLKRLETSSKSARSSYATKLEIVGLKKKEASLDSDQTRPLQDRTNDHDQSKENLRLTRETNELSDSKVPNVGEVLMDSKSPQNSFSMNIDKEVDIGNGLIFDMRPNLPEIRLKQESN